MQQTMRPTSVQARAQLSAQRSSTAAPLASVLRTPARLATINKAPITRCQSAAQEVVINVENGVATVVGATPAAPPAPLTEEQELAVVADQFNIWNAALQTGDPATVASLYAPDGVLLPTVSNVVRKDYASKVDYFTSFLKLKPFGVINESYVRFFSDKRDVASHSGIYTFTLQKPEGPAEVQARFTYVYKKVAGKWMIAEHHSSALPEVKADPKLEIAALFDAWNASLATGKPEKVADMYWDEAVLLPTVSNQVRTTRESRIAYFTDFLKLKPQGVIDERTIRFLSAERDVASDAGIYTFTLEKEGKPVKVQARYSFIYRKGAEGWKIMEHHSSMMPEVAPPSDDEVLKTVANMFNVWNAALATLDPEKVADLYHEESVLLPTVSNEVRTDRAGKIRYFTDFLKLKPQGVIDEQHVRFLSPAKDVASNSGVYTFTLEKEGKPTKVQARYSFVYHKQADGQWLIKEHHSSAMPEKVNLEVELKEEAAARGIEAEPEEKAPEPAPAKAEPTKKRGWW